VLVPFGSWLREVTGQQWCHRATPVAQRDDHAWMCAGWSDRGAAPVRGLQNLPSEILRA
jgi:hypothetical protein